MGGDRMNIARTVMQRIDALAKISEDPNCLTRTFCSPAMRRANALVASWMREAGMIVRTDTIGNLIGHYPCKAESRNQKSKVLLFGSHLDTVRNAGKFDGPLGVFIAIACVQQLHETKTRLPFAIEVTGFADEEGVRYQSAYLGSRVLARTFDLKDLKRVDADGISMAKAIRGFGGNPRALASAKLDPKRLLGYVEVHIEQGPVLEKKNLSVGVVTAIAGQTRLCITFTGRAGHAGTTPMNLRRDALCAAAEFVLEVERFARGRPAAETGLVATVGQISALPDTSNVIPGEVVVSLDIRHAKDSVRERGVAALRKRAVQIGRRRNIKVSIGLVQQSASVSCDRNLSNLLAKSIRRYQKEAPLLASGAGHDAVAMAVITAVAMLFVRCKGGISHHPDESVRLQDVRMAVSVTTDLIQRLASEFS